MEFKDTPLTEALTDKEYQWLTDEVRYILHALHDLTVEQLASGLVEIVDKLENASRKEK